MATALTTRITDGPGVDTVKELPLTSGELDFNFISLAENKLERENNLSDLTNLAAGRVNLDVPSREGGGAFGTWTISVTGNAASATELQNSRDINGVAFNGTSDITIEAATPNDLIFGNGLSSSGNFDGSTERILSVDTGVVVVTTGAQTLDGNKTFQNAVTLNTQATTGSHAVRADRLINSGNGITGGSDLTGDISLAVDTDVVVVTTGSQTIAGTKTFSNAVVLSTPGTLTTQAVRADRSVTGGDGLVGGGDLTGDRELSVDSTVIRTTGNQTLGGVKTFSNPPILTTPSTTVNEAVRSDREISGGDGITGGGNLTSDVTLDVDSTVIRTTGNQILGGNKSFSNALVLDVQGTAPNEAIRGSRELVAGSGISGGGDLTADRTFAVDSTVVRTFGSQTVGGTKTFSDAINITEPTTLTSQAVRADRTITGSDGITGGGDLSTDQTLSVDNTVIRTTGNQTLEDTKTFINTPVLGTQATALNQAVRSDREIVAGDGLDGGGDLSSDPTLSVDGTVIRTTGNFGIAGDIEFSGTVSLLNQAIDPLEAVRASREINGGDGIIGGGNLTSDRTLSVDSSVARSTTQIIAGNGLTGTGTLGSDITLNVADNVSIDAVSTQLSEIVDLVAFNITLGDINLIIGETVIGQTSSASGIITDITSDTDSVTISVRISSGSFDNNETIVGQTSGDSVSIDGADLPETFTAQDINSSGEVIDFIPSSAENIENVLDIPNALDKVLAIGGKTFDWTDNHLANKNGIDGYHVVKSDFGVVAEDVNSVFPQGVRQKDNGELVVDYRKLFALAFAAIQELNDKIP